mgnify:CR=1 FL=1
MNWTPWSAPSGMMRVPYPSLVHHATISPAAAKRVSQAVERARRVGAGGDSPSMLPTSSPGVGGACKNERVRERPEEQN